LAGHLCPWFLQPIATESCADATYHAQEQVLLLTINAGLDVQISRNDGGASFRTLYLLSINRCTDSQIFIHLLRSIERGAIVASSMYRSDVDVLLLVIRRWLDRASLEFFSPSPRVSCTSEKIRIAAQHCEHVLLRDAAPGSSGTIEEVSQWILMLGLRHDYRDVLKFEAIDGDVLWSDLSCSDLQQMGIYDEEDSQKILDVLRVTREEE
jgi:hypothetical protein